MRFVSTQYAARSIARNLRRTALSVAGIAVGCVLALFMESLNRGKGELFARMGATSGVGHVRVVPSGWRERRDPRLRLADWQTDAAAARALPGVDVVTVRARAQTLLAMGTHVVPVELAGVEPAVEPRTFRYVQRVQAGRYLREGDSGGLVIGRAIADRLDADIDDEIVATTVGSGGDIRNALFRIVGIVSTGTDDADEAVCQVTRDDLERLTGLPGAGEVLLVLNDFRRIDEARALLAPRLAPGDQALTLSELAPEIEGHLEQDSASSRFVSAIIILIVLLGVASAQLAAVLERRREFAVLSALGMGGLSMARLILLEALMLGLAGAAAGLALGAPLSWWLSREGLDFSRMFGSGYAFQGVLFEPVIYGDFGWWIAVYVAVVALGATTLASLYPAWYAARTDPAVALRVAQ
jgi:ABC-type lipoprotein release transport system permease subunit